MYRIALLTLLVSLSHNSPAESSLPPASDGDGSAITMNMQNADLRALIQWMADLSGKNFIVHRDVKGTATVVSSEPVSRDEAWQMFLQVLELNGYAAVNAGASVKIIPAAEASRSAGVGEGVAGDMRVSIIHLRKAHAQDLVTQLRPLLSQAGALSAYQPSNALIISDRSDNIERIRKLTAQLDRSGDSSFDMIALQYADAFEVMKAISSLLSEGGKQASVSMAVDQRSNALLIAGSGYQRSRLKALVNSMDKPVTKQDSTQVVYLHYVDAEALVPVLRGTLKSINDSNKDNDSDSIATVEASGAANALVINAPTPVQTRLKRVIKQLDIRRAQVLVEALIVDIIDDNGQQLGINWVSHDLNAQDRTGGFVANNTTGTLGSADYTLDSEGGIAGVSPGTGLSFGYIKDGDLRAVFRALSTTTRANVVSTPSVVALDNEEASLLVGQNVPFVSGQSTGAASQTDNPFTTVERQDIGTTLKITPRINLGDSVSLKIEQTTERINSDASNDAIDLITNKRQILTNALIRDGEILVVGGLISDEEAEVQQKTPLLGDIPILGMLFRSTSKVKQKTNLMVFIHPVILKDEMQVADITQRRYNFMRDAQQVYRGKKPVNWQESSPLLPTYEEYAPSSGARRNPSAAGP